MSGIGEASDAVRLTGVLDALATTDLVALDDQNLREQILDLLTAHHRTWAELVRRLDVFDRRGLAEADGFRKTKGWLSACARLSGGFAHRLVKAARLLRSLPKLAAATQTGDVTAEHVQQVARLADQVGGVEQLTDVDATLAEAAGELEPETFAVVCGRIRDHLNPDGPPPDEAFNRRALTLNPVAGMMALRGQLDPEGGSALATALDSLMTPPAQGDARTAAQRRADALVELARLHLAAGDLPTVGGQRPQVGLLLFPQALSPQLREQLAAAQQDALAADRLRDLATNPGMPAPGSDWTRPDTPVEAYDQAGSVFGRTAADMRDKPDNSQPGHTAPDPADPPETSDTEAATTRATEPDPRGGDQAAAFRGLWRRPGWNDPPFLNWLGPIPPETAQRIACDSDIFRIILDPSTGMPLDVGRSHRLVPYWMRKALFARDRGCRWYGCTARAEWTDAHHLDPWVENGETKIERVCLLCRFHHCLVHEGGWRLDLDPGTGEVHITRPDGTPYQLPTRSRSWNGPATRAE